MKGFRGVDDDSVISLKNVLPGTALVFSTPFEFESKRSGVYIEGELEHLEILFKYLNNLLMSYIEEKFFGRWIAITPPDEFNHRIVMHYEYENKMDKIQLLSLILPKHLAKICDIFVSATPLLTVKVNKVIIFQNAIFLIEEFANGKILLSSRGKKSESVIVH